ncbi:aquaporin family protein [Pseudonocardiaceae bacterium YIM PH 21723]|nr:aquaporin family protein [Pseudonocardiaceae bacterium YIM PH 21723]
MTEYRFSARLLAEALGTCMLLTSIVSAGIMFERVPANQYGIRLLGISATIAAALSVIIAIFRPISGAHLNPVVTLFSGFKGSVAAAYIAAQCTGAISGVMVSHAMFQKPLVYSGGPDRLGPGVWIGEIVATAGLVLTGRLLTHHRQGRLIPRVVPTWVFAAIMFSSSTCFANPAATLARAFTGTVTGISWASVPGYLLAEVTGATLGVLLAKTLCATRAQSIPLDSTADSLAVSSY